MSGHSIICDFHLSCILFQEFHRNFAILLKRAALERVMNHNDLPGTKTFDWLDCRLTANLHSVDGFIIKVLQYPPPPPPASLPSIEIFSQENWLNATKQIDEIYKRRKTIYSLQSKLIKNSNLKILMIWIEWENVLTMELSGQRQNLNVGCIILQFAQ